jgi:hypothetical protein
VISAPPSSRLIANSPVYQPIRKPSRPSPRKRGEGEMRHPSMRHPSKIACGRFAEFSPPLPACGEGQVVRHRRRCWIDDNCSSMRIERQAGGVEPRLRIVRSRFR